MTRAPLAPAMVSRAAQTTGRWPYGFGPRFFLLLATGLVWLIPTRTEPRAIAAMAIWDMLVLVAWWVDAKRLPPSASLHVRRLWDGPLALGIPSRVAIEIDNRGRVPIEARLVDDAAPAVRRELTEIVARVGAGGVGRSSYEIDPRARGDAVMGSVAIRYRSWWRLAERWASAPLAQTVRVYPDLPAAERHAMYLIRARQVAIEKRRTHVRGRGREFDSLREFRDGDEPRDICWTATARRGRLVTKVYQPERSQPVWIVVDAGRLLRARVGRPTKLDLTVNAALALAEVALTSGDRVGLLAYGRRAQQLLPAARGPLHLRAIVEALASVRAEGLEADHAAAAGIVLANQKRRSLVVWLTDLAETAGTPDVIESASALLPRHVVLFGVMQSVEIAALAASSPASASDMYRIVAAQETIERRETLLGALRQRGALAVELSPADVSAAVVERYLTVKEKNLV